MSSRSHRSGHVLLGTMTFLILAMLAWLAAFSALSSNVRTARMFLLRQDHDHGAVRALAWGLALLETGDPPGSPYSCRATVDTNRTYVMTFTLTPPNQASVSVRPATAGDSTLPYAPEEF
jgi:hypothetical protein